MDVAAAEIRIWSKIEFFYLVIHSLLLRKDKYYLFSTKKCGNVIVYFVTLPRLSTCKDRNGFNKCSGKSGQFA